MQGEKAEAAALHINLVFRKKRILASTAHECAVRTMLASTAARSAASSVDGCGEAVEAAEAAEAAKT